MTTPISSPGQSERPRRYVVNIAGLELQLEYAPGEGWVVTSKRSGELLLAAKKAWDLVRKKRLLELRREIVRELCGDDEECRQQKMQEIRLADIRNALREQFLSKVAVRRRIPKSGSATRVVAYTPLWYISGIHVAGALVYREVTEGHETRIEPRLIITQYDENGDMWLITAPSVHLLEAMGSPIQIGHVRLYIKAPAYKEALAAGDIGSAEEAASEQAEEMLALLGPAWPDEERVLYWLDRTKSDPIAWMRWLYAEVLAREINKWAWPKLRGRRLLPLIPLAVTFSPVFDFIVHIIFSGRRGSGKSLHIGMLASLIPYTFRISQASVPSLDRIRTYAICVAFDEFTAGDADLYWLVRSFTQKSGRIVTSPDRKGVIAFTGGWAILVPDLGQIAEKDRTGAATSRSIVFHLVTDNTMAKATDSLRELQEDGLVVPLYSGLGPDGKEVVLTIEDLHALQVALYLRLAGKVRKTYKELDKEISEKAKRRELGVEPRRVQAFVPLLVIARLIGPDVEEEVWRYLRETSEESPSQTWIVVVDALRYVWENGTKDPEIRKDIREFDLDGNRRVLLVKPSAVVNAAMLVREGGETRELTERSKIEEGDNLTLRKTELWPRRKLPEELQSADKFDSWLKRETYYAKYLLGTAKDKNGNWRKHIILTLDVLELMEHEAWRNLEAAEETFKRICADVRDFAKAYPNVLGTDHPIFRECAPYWSSATERQTPPDGGGGGVEQDVTKVAETRLTQENTIPSNGAREDLSTPPPAPPSTVNPYHDKSHTENAVHTTAPHNGESFKEENKVSNTQPEGEKVVDQPTGERRVVKPEDVISWLKKITQEWA